MLKQLHIDNFAIIQNLEIKFKAGLTTFTGETGAGKSILLDAIEALVGGRTDSTMIRSGAEYANLEAIFSIPTANRDALLGLLEREGLSEDEKTVILNCEIRREGRNIARINGRSVNVTLLRELGEFLVDIHGQSEHLSLLKVREHLGLLDRHANSQELLENYQTAYKALKSVQRELADLRRAEQDAARQQDLLTYQIQEIEAAKLQPGEEAKLRQELSRLANAEKLASLTQKALSLLEDANPETPSISTMLGEAAQAVRSLATIDQSMHELADQCESLSVGANDMSLELQDYLNQVEYNPKRLEQVENRLALLSTLKRKYGENEKDILAFAQKAREQLEKISGAEERIASLEIDERRLQQDAAEKALALSQKREEAAQSLSVSVENELGDLQMAGARFQVAMQKLADQEGLPLAENEMFKFDETGIDQVEFLIEPNPGEGLKPLVKIASGGETSRLMLALKNVLTRADTIPTLIFDEIDQGIGGRVGSLVGEKLWQLGKQHQVFCVTHLPQLAAFGNQHYRVWKQVQGGRTLTVVDTLDGEVRINELASMFGGVSEANREAALEALWSAKQRTAATNSTAE